MASVHREPSLTNNALLGFRTYHNPCIPYMEASTMEHIIVIHAGQPGHRAAGHPDRRRYRNSMAH